MNSYISLFGGAGGLDLGFTRAGFFPSLMFDEDRAAADTLRAAFPGTAVYQADVHDVLNSETLSQDLGMTLVTGQPPLVGGMVRGPVDPDGDQPQMMYRFLDTVAQARPDAFAMFGIPAWKSGDWSGVMERCRKLARDYGYDTFLPGLDAAHYGVPQRKQKSILIGMPKGTRPDITAARKLPRLPAGPALNLAARENGELGVRDVPCEASVALHPRPELRSSPYSSMLLAGNGKVLDLTKQAPPLPGDLTGSKVPVIDLGQLERGDPPWAEEYHERLWRHRLSVLPRVPDGVRMERLTLRQCAALQGFPAGHPFRGSALRQFKMTGRAVPPALAEAVGRSIAAGLGDA